MINFNQPYLTGRETAYIEQAVRSGKLSGNGTFTKKCQAFFEKRYGIGKALLTTSCTDALEMAALLMNIKAGDEVIVPSYTFVSSALAFVREGAKIVFVDSGADHPNLDAQKVEELITPRTRAIVAVHYAGAACDMASLMTLANKYGLYVVEDAAQAVESYYTWPSGERQACGSIGHFAAFSFHETKNVIAGEGGLLAINDAAYFDRAEILWEKGTNRAQFFRGEINKYGWVDTGSSFLPSEITAAFLWAQLENIERIQARRLMLWELYYNLLQSVTRYDVKLPVVPVHATNNAHMFYLVCTTASQRDYLIASLRSESIKAVFHYLSLHSSAFYRSKHDGRILPNCDLYANCLVRLPMFYELTEQTLQSISSSCQQAFATYAASHLTKVTDP